MVKHYILYIPGLGDSKVSGQRLAIGGWRLWGVRTRLLQMNWADSRPFAPKLQMIVDTIDTLHAQGYTVSLVAASAGASAALNAYRQRLETVHSVTLICGQVLGGKVHVSARTYGRNRAFAESMERLEESLPALSEDARRRIMSLHPIADPVVPVADTKLPGAHWRRLPVSGHAMTIAYALTIGSLRIVRDIRRIGT